MEEKQIEEMARLLCGQAKSCNECSVHKPCLMMNCARILTDNGYRKASDVAREIFEELEKLMLDGAIGGKYPTKVINPEKYDELKKKYESEGGE